MSFDLEWGRASVAGRKPANEDRAGHAQGQGSEAGHGAIGAIADGVSTGGLGAEAASTLVGALLRDYFATPGTWDTSVALDRVLLAHNQWLAGMNRRRRPAMGLSTLTALVLRGQTWTLAHVGDTRAYLLRGGLWQQLTTDHVLAHRDFAHQLTRSVGSDERLLVDYLQGDLLEGDRFVLLTDGVHGVLSEHALRGLAGTPGATPQAVADALVQAALSAGSRDDCTALVLQVRGASQATLHDRARQAHVLPVPPRLRTGDLIDGLRVLGTVSDTGTHLLYRVAEAAPPALLDEAVPAEARHFALKALAPQRAHDAVERDMLAHEAWLAERLQEGRAGRHLARLHAAPPGGEATAFYLLYDWLEGETLAPMLSRRPPVDIARAVDWAIQATQALGLLHRQGVIHRDIKPDNLHVGADGVVRVLDLGVALSGREPEATRLLHAGTASYINPEQWPGYDPALRGEAAPAEARGDLFALGVTLYQLLAGGRLPYGEVMPYQLGRYHRDPVPPSRLNPSVPIWLDHLVLKAVARSAEQRFETAEELLLALQRGASRPLPAPAATPLAARSRLAPWQVALAFSLLLNLLLVCLVLVLRR